MKLLKQKGFTLIEMLLVLVVIGMLIFMATSYMQQQALQSRTTRMALQMQQILNATLAFYVSNGKWPSDLQCLQGSSDKNDPSCQVKYLSDPFVNPWGSGTNSYGIAFDSDCAKDNPTEGCPVIYVIGIVENIGAQAPPIASIIAGKLPNGYIAEGSKSKGGFPSNPPPSGTCTGKKGCYVVASVNIPGQNLNNAGNVNYAGLYHHGACVPAPTCPAGTEPEIMVVPAQVTGVNTAPASGSDCSKTVSKGCTVQANPISSFTAYAVGDSSNNPTHTPAACPSGGSDTSCDIKNDNSNIKYWRVCMQVVTEYGDISTTYPPTQSGVPDWGAFVSALAITRCAITGEQTGSPWSVYSN